MRKIILGTFLILAVNLTGWAQGVLVKGVVTSEAGETLPGVNVIIKGTTKGIITGLNGDYEISVNEPGKAILQFSFIGFETVEVPVKNQRKIDVTLKASFTELDEVVAIGYGSVTKKDLTGSVASVNVEELDKVPTSNLAQSLGGRVAGVQVSTAEGAPGAKISIRVRGGGSITQSNEPLYIIDGFPTEDGLDNLDPSDIESIDILKDASSTAIYGARGANGVILVTTKGGTAGKTTVNYDTYYGVKQIANSLEVMNPYDFVLLDYERSYGDDDDMQTFTNRYGTWEELEGLYRGRPGVDWQDELFGRNATNQYHKISITGGTPDTKYNLSYSYNDDEGIMVNSGFKRNMAKFKFNHKVSEKLKATASINYTDQKVRGMGTSEGKTYFNKLQHTIQYRPTIGKNGDDRDLVLLDEDPALEDITGNVMQNPLASAEAEHRLTEKRNLAINGMLDYEIIKGLHYKLTIGMQRSDVRKEIFDGERSVMAKRTGGPSGSIRHTDRQGYSYSNVLSYKTKLGSFHRFDALIGQEKVYSKWRWIEASASQFPNDDIGLADLSLGTLPGIPMSNEQDSKLLSFFGRVNYSLMDKYLLTVTYRADGSSKFGSGNKYGYFPSASFAWRAIEESFIKDLGVFSNLKFRLTYGVAGNNRIANYLSLALLSSGYYPLNNVPAIGVASTVLPNPNLRWETTTSKNLGIDMGFLDQRIQATVDMYITNTDDLLLQSQIPMTSGYPVMMRNVGETQNKGFELSLTTVNVKAKNFEWRSDFNISVNRNKVIALDGQDFFLRESSWGGSNVAVGNDYIVEVGQPVGSIYGFINDGLYQIEDFDYDPGTQTYTIKDGIPYKSNETPQPGYWKFRDISGPDGKADGVITLDDRTIIGNTNPKHFGGLTNTFIYKNFDLSVFVNWSYGNDVYNANKMYYTMMHLTNKNMLDIASDRWMSIDANGTRVTDPTILAEMNKGKTIPVWDGAGRVDPKLHSWAIEDGSFLRINNINFGYSFPKSLLNKIGVNKLRVYATLNNIHTFTKYSGFDPDVSTRNASGVTPGVDWGAYPRSKSVVFGVNLSL